MNSQQRSKNLPAEHRKSFCMAPFSQMLLAPTGDFFPCCYHFGHRLGKIDQPVNELWNGSKMRKLRREFLTGDVRICRSRIANLACHQEFEYWQQQVTPQEIMPDPPVRLDIRLSGQCNLQCIMCDVWQQPTDRYDESWLWSDGPEKLFPFLREVDIAGGEPFIQAQVYRLIATIFQHNPEVEFSFISNGNFHNTQKVLRTLRPLHVKRIQLSLDALDEQTYRAIRLRGDFKLLMHNLEAMILLRQQKGFQLKVSFCITQQNWSQIQQFIAFADDHNLDCELQYAHYDPSQKASLSLLPHHKLVEIYDSISHYENTPSVQPILNALRLTLARLTQPQPN